MGFLETLRGEEEYNVHSIENQRFPDLHPNRKPDILGDDLKTKKLEVKVIGEKLGKSLFARESFNVGEEIFVFDGKKVLERKLSTFLSVFGNPNNVVVGRESQHGKIFFGDFIYSMPDDKSPLRYLNHSCEYNIARSENDPFAFLATREIKSGDPITTDYSLLEVHKEWEMACHCGAKECRQHILSAPRMGIDYLASNWHHLPEFMKQTVIEFSSQSEIITLRGYGIAEGVRMFAEKFVSKQDTHE